MRRAWVFAVVLAAAAAETPPPSWRGWDEYQVILWSAGEAPAERDFPLWVERLRALGFTAAPVAAGDSSAPWTRAGFGFYVDNIIAGLGFHGARAPLYQADRQRYEATRDRRFLFRNPSFEDPSFQQQAAARAEMTAARHAAGRPLLYNLRDEPSIASFTSPMDYSFDPHTLTAFRAWLRREYGSLERLNGEWETSFSRWEDVTPFTTFEIKDREREELAGGRPENYAPWADHRAFMDISFTGALARLRDAIRRVDATTPVGIAGSQMPSAWGGADLWLLSRAVDWVEPYDIAGSRKILGSFLPPGAPLLSTVFGGDLPRIRRQLWRLLLMQDRGAIVWEDEDSRVIDKRAPGMPGTARGNWLAPLWKELKAAAPAILAARPERDRIAIHYSQASIRAHWMLDSRADGRQWMRRLASYEQVHSGMARTRDGFARVVEDAGFDYDYVSYEQVERNRLIEGGYRVLLLPQSIAMSALEARRIREFAEAGGTVIADNSVAAMDEHCRRLAAPQLDELFGVRSGKTLWRPVGNAGGIAAGRAAPLGGHDADLEAVTGTPRRRTASGAPAFVERRAGKGRAVYLNVDMREYSRLRLHPAAGAGYVEAFGGLLRESGLAPPVRVNAPGVVIFRYTAGETRYLALMRNPETDSELARGASVNRELEQRSGIRIVLPARYRARDLRSGRDWGEVDSIEAELDPWSPLIFELRAAR